MSKMGMVNLGIERRWKGIQKSQRVVGEVWKDGNRWKVQFPFGVETVRTKRQAEIISSGWFGTDPKNKDI